MEAEGWSLAVAVAGTLAGVAGAWFAYVAVRGQVLHHRSPPQPVAEDDPGRPYDVFIAHTAADKDRAATLARDLDARGYHVFLAAWSGIGLITVLEKERALRRTANGLLLFSRATMADPAVRSDYAALLERVHRGGRLLVPVLIERVALPAYAEIRRPLDLTDRRHYQQNLTLLVQALGPPSA